MKSIEEFNEGARKYSRAMIWTLSIPVVVTLIMMFTLLPLRQVVFPYLVDWFGWEYANAASGVLMLPPVLTMFGSFWLLAGMARRDPRCYCDFCSKYLADNRHVVVATKCCPHCGNRVLQDPKPACGD